MCGKSVKSLRNINWQVHYFYSVAFNSASSLFFRAPSRSGSAKLILWSNAVPSLWPYFCTHTSSALSLPLFSAPSSHSPLHLPPPGPAGPLSGGHRVLTCLHLPPALADQWAQLHGGSLFFEAGHSPRVSPSPLFSQPLTPGHGNRGRNVRSDWQDKERSPSRRAQADLRHFHRGTMADLGLDWITDELMTVKRAHRLYISPIISVWRRGVGGVAAVGLVGWVEGAKGELDAPLRRRSPGIEKDVNPGPGREARGLYHPPGAFNKSIQAIRGPHACGPNHRKMCRGWECV